MDEHREEYIPPYITIETDYYEELKWRVHDYEVFYHDLKELCLLEPEKYERILERIEELEEILR